MKNKRREITKYRIFRSRYKKSHPAHKHNVITTPIPSMRVKQASPANRLANTIKIQLLSDIAFQPAHSADTDNNQ